MSNSFKNKTAVITGGNSGIGYAAAKEFKERGATVIITGRRKDALDRAAEELGVHSILADQGSLADIDQLAATVKAQYNKIDFLFINAGMTGGVFPIEYGSVANFEEVMNVNARGPYFTLSKFIPLLNDGASVVFLSSIATQVSAPLFSVYSASKAALNAIAKTAALELAARKIRVNIVSPGPTNTNLMTRAGVDPELQHKIYEGIMAKSPLGRKGEPEEIAKTVVHLCEDSSAYITGADIVIDGGMALS
ncbi:SDR family oxidoreductase [Mucilaginibacter lappiensis]|uniref:NAD(P)-dependent dehydrogenase (Short-subunit alcohol dehydrogenase family) n=1 Tax=Mucilaginibacter lappiensis TaxID=354630 RepID=A0A1N6Y566_9SPHI|nr:SDR family oxidoreductase [Mucilaginibacter lappiensis]MBB6109623.1 NAD(P)-dependent dehydrogenase (short-subunit alcohol dehydrogenase family) [Mucilaginibacter lappiensis]MBB6128926.1 NAD(P)-dependent dehydrogenase (short-subunit alcohol dehydrogenase family) [Mucilaginibacter lappiensis]SIR09772.1 NAD(P)-dependent dehydrogenase, short-chain alcohol dehydrogenase family [Mucilaginibacter lappiensis]